MKPFWKGLFEGFDPHYWTPEMCMLWVYVVGVSTGAILMKACSSG